MIQFKPGQKILEIGGGDRPQFRPNMDIRPGACVDVVHDFNKPFPLESNSLDGIFSMYLIEHLSWRKVKGFISEMHRVIRPGGSVFIVTANLLEQCKTLVNLKEWEEKYVCMLFGDQNYEGTDWVANAHHCGFSPEYAKKLIKDSRFSDIRVSPHPNCHTDMIIEATKPMLIGPDAAGSQSKASLWTPEEREKAFDWRYFDGGVGEVGGYAREGYWDYPCHWTTFEKVMNQKPESVLELGCGSGYIIKKIEDMGVAVRGLEISRHCLGTAVTKSISQHDLTKFPWPIGDKDFDLCFSIATLEHIPETVIPEFCNELERVSKRGLHGIDFGEKDDGFDKTHCTLRSKTWWQERLPKGHVVVNKEDLESGPIPLPKPDGKVKLNIGCHTTMFHDGWTNIDISPLQSWAQHYNYVFRQHDITQGLPYDDACVDLVFACHVIEHLNFRQGESFLKDCRRVMKKGSVIRILTPNAEEILGRLREGSLSIFDEINVGCANAKSQMERAHALLCSGHSSMYDAPTLLKMLTGAGFMRAEKMEFRNSLSKQILKETNDMYPQLSLFVDAVA